MRRKNWIVRISALVLALMLAVCGITCGISASAAEDTTTMIQIDNTKGDVQPIIRIGLQKLDPTDETPNGVGYDYTKGGPFTVSFDLKIEKFRRQAGQDVGYVYVNIWHPDMGTTGQNEPAFENSKWSGNMDWTSFSFTFPNLHAWVLNDGTGQVTTRGLIDIGVLWANPVVSIKNFQIKNAAGEVVWSFDSDYHIQKVADLREMTGEVICLNTGFGALGSAKFPITQVAKDGGGNETEVSSGPVFETPSTPGTETSKPTEDEKPSTPSTSKPAEDEKSSTPSTETSTPEDASQGSEDVSSPEDASQGSEDVSSPEDASTPADDASTPADDASKPAGNEDQSTGQTVIVKSLAPWVVPTLIAVGVVLVAGVAVLIFLVLKKKNVVSEEATEETESAE